MRPTAAALAVLAALIASPAAHAESKNPGLPPSIKIKALMVPVVNRGQIERYALYDVTMELADSSKLPDAQAKITRLQDAVLTVVYGAIEQGWIVRGNIANATALRARLDEAGQKLIGKASIARVLIMPVGRQSSLN
ncbi:hypothetical protein [Azospirillum sp.]|uniref:hypothetical protein n=1 Tax=Azospirillum sp. TaxID=34012 RepID=UPI003D711933